MVSIGLVANPASGKDIRRLVAHGSVFDNNEKINIIRRLLRALDAYGVSQVLAMPDVYGLVLRALEDANVNLHVEFVNIPLTNSGEDSTAATQLMVEAGVACIVTIGGDGTNRVVAKASGSVPLVPISTGTNNVFPFLVEGTLAGMAAAVVALDVPGVREKAVYQAPRLALYRNRTLVDIALVDVVVYDERFVASRAIWEASKMRTLVLTRPYVGTLGASAIAAYLPEVTQSANHGLWIELGPGGREVKVPIAPGLIVPVSIRRIEWLKVGQGGTIHHAPCVLALDGEREIPLYPGETIHVRLERTGPFVVDIHRAVQAAIQAGFFLQKS